MLDIEFLAADKPTIRQNITYEHRTGIFQPQVTGRVRQHAQSKGTLYREVEYESFAFSISESSLFGELLVHIDLDELKAKVKDHVKAFDLLVQGITSKTLENRFYITVSAENDTFIKSPNWTLLTKGATSLNEPSLSTQGLPKIVDFLCDQCPLYDYSKLGNRQSFDAAMKEVPDTEMTMPAFVQQFELITVICINPETHLFDTTQFRALQGMTKRSDFYRLHKLLFDVLNSPTTPTITALTREADRLLTVEQWEARQLTGALMRSTKDLIFINASLVKGDYTPATWSPYKAKRLKPYGTVELATLLRWQLLLASNEPLLNHANPVLTLHNILIQFQAGGERS